MMKNEITEVEIGSIAEEMEIEKGDILLEINGKAVSDIFDYRYLISDEFLEVLIRKKDGEEWLLEIEKEENEDLGISFKDPMMDKATSCNNKCIFCFIDQLPKGMRKTLYFKDDDSRLSFLQGNYVTLTNIDQQELDRIVFYHLSPINVSVHATNPDLRAKMLKNKKAGKVMEQLNQISDGGIELNGQIVLVKGVNDGAELDRTLSDLLTVNGMRSVSIVPVGLTEHREKLEVLLPFEQTDAARVIEQIERFQIAARKKKGTNFVYASDEFYIKAGKKLPEYEAYDDFPQLENGVGMVTFLDKEFYEALENAASDGKKRNVSIVTGKSAFDFIERLAKKTSEKFTNLTIKVIMVENNFFGEKITVSGLLTGSDILRTLSEQNVKGRVLLPENAFKFGEQIFLDDVSLSSLEEQLSIEAVIVKNDGESFLNAILDSEETINEKKHSCDCGETECREINTVQQTCRKQDFHSGGYSRRYERQDLR